MEGSTKDGQSLRIRDARGCSARHETEHGYFLQTQKKKGDEMTGKSEKVYVSLIGDTKADKARFIVGCSVFRTMEAAKRSMLASIKIDLSNGIVQQENLQWNPSLTVCEDAAGRMVYMVEQKEVSDGKQV